MKASKYFKIVVLLLSISLVVVLTSCAQSIPALKYSSRNSTYTYSADVQINYEVIGRGRKKIVFVHGFGTSLHTWDDIKELFPKEEYKLYLIDMKGFGNSSKPEDDLYTLQEQAKIVVSFIKHINSGPFYLIGHSYGGGVALQADIMLSNEKGKPRIDKLILIDCLAYLQDVPLFVDFLTIPVVNKIPFLLSDKLKSEYIIDKIFYDKTLINEKLISRYASYYYDEGIPYTFITTANQINPEQYEKIIGAYKSITTKCLIIWGGNDSVLLLENGIKLSKEIPNAQIEIISECGHSPHEEKPDVTFSRILRFLKK
ncbi:MAG: alpha/beta hydrolase [Bacteroidota bacterium]